MAIVKNGAKVRQVVPAPIEGEVFDVGIDKVSLDRLFYVGWGEKTTDAEGAVHFEHSRAFREGEIEEVPEVAQE